MVHEPRAGQTQPDDGGEKKRDARCPGQDETTRNQQPTNQRAIKPKVCSVDHPAEPDDPHRGDDIGNRVKDPEVTVRQTVLGSNLAAEQRDDGGGAEIDEEGNEEAEAKEAPVIDDEHQVLHGVTFSLVPKSGRTGGSAQGGMPTLSANISRMTPGPMVMVPLFHRQRNSIPSTAKW